MLKGMHGEDGQATDANEEEAIKDYWPAFHFGRAEGT